MAFHPLSNHDLAHQYADMSGGKAERIYSDGNSKHGFGHHIGIANGVFGQNVLMQHGQTADAGLNQMPGVNS